MEAMVTEEIRATQLQQHSPKQPMALSISHKHNLCYNTLPIIPIFVASLLLISPVLSVSDNSHHPPENQTLRPGKELLKLKRIQSHLRKINKPAVKTIQSPDGDIIDCVESHLQPAFDHPLLKGQKPLAWNFIYTLSYLLFVSMENLSSFCVIFIWERVKSLLVLGFFHGQDPPVKPNGFKLTDTVKDSIFQLWTSSKESCPQGTIPIRRTTEKDVLRSNTIRSFGRKSTRSLRKEQVKPIHEHAVGFVKQKCYGAKAGINVWQPQVAKPDEFSLSQLWVISGSFGHDLNTIEAGWQVSPKLYGDNESRFFTYWTSDAYQTTGCYNLLCSGFVQINSKIAIGAAISPYSLYEREQFDIELLVWKDPKKGNWWLQYGSDANSSPVGYWPASLFSHLRDSAEMIQFGGEIVNNGASGTHTATQMGSGHFSGEGFQKASYFRNLQVVDYDNNLIPPTGLRSSADHPNCYDITQGSNLEWGTFLYFGGPGKNIRCP